LTTNTLTSDEDDEDDDEEDDEEEDEDEDEDQDGPSPKEPRTFRIHPWATASLSAELMNGQSSRDALSSFLMAGSEYMYEEEGDNTFRILSIHDMMCESDC